MQAMRLIFKFDTVVHAFVCVLLLAGCKRGSESEATAPPPPPDVVVAEVTQATIPIIAVFSGTLQAVKTVDIVPRVSGYINKRYFKEGTHVKKGTLLYLIDPRPYQATLEADKAQLKHDEASHVFWQGEVKRYTPLAKMGAASKQQLENAIANEQEKRATVDKDKANIEKAKLNLSFTRITAPFSGRIESTQVNVGALVDAEKDVLTTVVQIDPIYAVFNISRRQLEQFQRLMRKGVVTPGDLSQFEAEVVLPDGSAYPHRGHLDFVSVQIDSTTDMMMARAVFPNVYQHPRDVRLIPGQYAPLRLIVGEESDALLIPKAALVETQAGKQVFVVDKDNKVRSRRVEVGTAHQGQWVIKKGLKKGERVVVEGMQKVRPGMLVKPGVVAAK